MNGFMIIILAAVVLVSAYMIYGRYLVKKWGIDPDAKTPAYTEEDGVDYVPADTSVVFGHQFASIAGAAPITGPIQAAVFGWLPALLWILIGGVFFGAVQDFAAMYASVKNKGRSIGYIIEKYIGRTGKRLFLIFVWLFSILVIAAFADVVASTFQGFDEEGVKIAADGAVATTSILFIVFAVGLGLFLKKTSFHAGINTLVAILLLLAAIMIGMNAPVYFRREFWLVFVFVYILIGISYKAFYNTYINFYYDKALGIVKMLANETDGDQIVRYVDTGSTDEAYDAMLSRFNNVKANTSGLSYLYLMVPYEDHFVYVIDAYTDQDEMDNISALGSVFEYGETEYAYLLPDVKAKCASTQVVYGEDAGFGRSISVWAPVSDVSGKGVPAALFMVIGKTLIKDHTKPGRDLGEVFTEVNNLLCKSNSEGMFITAFEGVLDLVTGEFDFVNAGHEIPFLCKKDGVFAPYKIRAGFVLAGMEGICYQSGSMQLEPGDKIFQYTDGVTEATNKSNELYGMERLNNVLCKNAALAPTELLPKIKMDIDAFVGDAPQFDDITMLCLEYLQPSHMML